VDGVDSAATEAKAREFLQRRFEACYPFHPATLSVFQRKWHALPQYRQTRGTLAMLAQWISIAAQEGFRKARTESLITLGSAPLAEPGFRSVVLGQLGESRLVAAIDTDIAGEQAHSMALDADTPRLTLVVADPDLEWSGGGSLRTQHAVRDAEDYLLSLHRIAIARRSPTYRVGAELPAAFASARLPSDRSTRSSASRNALT
jgi:hypothetical protein